MQVQLTTNKGCNLLENPNVLKYALEIGLNVNGINKLNFSMGGIENSLR